MRVLVLDGNENQAVAAVRSLAHAGHQVCVGASSSWSKAGWSRYCHSTFVYPSPERDPGAFLRRIAEETDRVPGTLVLPMTERTTLPLSARRDMILAAGGRMVLPSHATVLRTINKRETTELAGSLGIAVPRSVYIENMLEAQRCAASFPYPAVLKPCRSVDTNSSGEIHSTGRPQYARNPEEFLAAYKKLKQPPSGVVAQEFVEGTGVGYFALMREGELRAEFAHRRIRDVHPTGSGSAVRVSVVPDPRVREASLTILRKLQWHGVAMVEFRQGAEGTPVFLEVNGRFWQSLPLAVYAGADFPALLARLAEDGDVNGTRNYQVGVRCRWLLGDLRHLLAVWRGAPSQYPGKFPGRLSTLANFLLPVRGTRHDNFTMHDVLPELGDWLDFILRRLPANGRRAAVRRQLHA